MKVKMKPEEMSSDELADCIESARLAPAKYLSCEDLGFHGAAIREAATRLRMADAMAKALDIEVGMNKVAAKDSVRLKRRIMLAEETLEMIEGIRWDTFEDIGNLRDNIMAMIKSWRFKVEREGIKKE